MATQVHIQKTRDTILGMLALLDRKVGRTELVKLVYLSDSRFFESTGRTITGITYMWDHYGPNAVGHATANEADQMVNEGSVRVEIRPSMYSGYAYDYWVDCGRPKSKLLLRLPPCRCGLPDKQSTNHHPRTSGLICHSQNPSESLIRCLFQG